MRREPSRHAIALQPLDRDVKLAPSLNLATYYCKLHLDRRIARMEAYIQVVLYSAQAISTELKGWAVK